MINIPHSQKGSARIVIIVLAVILLGALGFVFWQNFMNKKPAAREPEVTKTENQPKDEYANWKTYTNTRDSYSIKYPSDWFIVAETTNDGPYIRNFDPNAQPTENTNQPEEAITLRVLKTDANDAIFAGSTATGWYENLGTTTVSNGPVTYTPDNTTNYELNGLSAKKTESVFTETNEDIFLINNGALYNISLHPSGTSSNETVKKILASFTFLQ